MNAEDGIIPTRGSLLTRLKDWDDQESWKDFFDTYWKLIYGVAVKAGLTDAEAQEVVQETIIAVAKRMGAFKYDPALGSFKGWLLHLARWRVADQFRKRARAPSQAAPPVDEGPRTPTVERIPDPDSLNLDAVWEEAWQKNVWDAAIARAKRKVGGRQYQLFDLYVLQEWPVEDIVKTMGVSRYQVYQAKSRMARCIRKEVVYLETRML